MKVEIRKPETDDETGVLRTSHNVAVFDWGFFTGADRRYLGKPWRVYSLVYIAGYPDIFVKMHQDAAIKFLVKEYDPQYFFTQKYWNTTAILKADSRFIEAP